MSWILLFRLDGRDLGVCKVIVPDFIWALPASVWRAAGCIGYTLALYARCGMFQCAQETICLEDDDDADDDDESEQHDAVANALVLDRSFVSQELQQEPKLKTCLKGVLAGI